MKGFILAAGLGTRLRPLTNQCAKPALPVLGIPTFWYGLWYMVKELGIKEIAINCGHAKESLEPWVHHPLLKKWDVNVFLSDESNGILGSSGGLKKIQDWLGDTLLAVYNGDCISTPPWKKLLKMHQKSKGFMTLGLRKHQNSVESYTDIECDTFGRVLNFGPKKNSGIMFSGAYFIESQALKRLPEGKSELMETLLKPLSQERQLFAAVDEFPWFDTGTVKTYFETQFELMKTLPEFKPLVEELMKEIKPGCYIPKNWKSETIKADLVAPVVMTGEYSEWKTHLENPKLKFGPKFIGIKPPKENGTYSENISFESGLISS